MPDLCAWCHTHLPDNDRAFCPDCETILTTTYPQEVPRG